jgi:branched-chain amino acid transport system substrate-binding protein
MNRRSIVTAAAATLISTAPHLIGAQTSAPRTDPLRIGVTFPLTGPLAPSARLTLVGAEIAVADINKRGGVRGRPLQLIVEDSQGNPEGGVAAMRKVVQVDGVQAVLTIYTNVVTAQMPLADQLKVPIFSTIETPGIAGRAQYSFAHSQTITRELPLFRDYWRAAGYKRIAAVYGDNATGHAMAPPVKATAQEIGSDLTEWFFDQGSPDDRGVVARIKEYAPDAIFITAQGSTGEQTMIRQIRELGITAPIFSPANTYREGSWRRGVGEYSEGMFFGGLSVDEVTSRDFVRAYQARTSEYPTYIAAEAYDIISIYAAAFAKVPYDGTAIRDFIASTNGVRSVLGGTIVMGPDHYSLNGDLALWRAEHGRLVRTTPPKRP